MKTLPNVDDLVKCVGRVLENPFWIPTLKVDEIYSRTHDDHDGTWEGKVELTIDRMGDIWVIIGQRSLRFRTMGGGGMSLRTRNALMILAEAIRLDNLERPEPKVNR